MNICQNCGVELEENMRSCPLCGLPVNSVPGQENLKKGEVWFETDDEVKSRTRRKIFWEITTIILGLAIVITFLLNIIINKEVSWSEYPVAICLIIFSYISAFSLWRTKIIFQTLGAFFTASVLLFFLDMATDGISWVTGLAIPILFFSNIILIALALIISKHKERGIILIAYCLLAAALICISIEAVTDNFINYQVQLAWSLIVSACIVPISAFLFFIHYRLKKKGKLTKTFHI